MTATTQKEYQDTNNTTYLIITVPLHETYHVATALPAISMAKSKRQRGSIRRIQTSEELMEEFNKLKEASTSLTQEELEIIMEEFAQRFSELNERKYADRELVEEKPIVQKKAVTSSAVHQANPIQKRHKEKCRQGGIFGTPQTHGDLVDEFNKLKDLSVSLSQEELDRLMAEFTQLSRELRERERELLNREWLTDEESQHPVAERGCKTDTESNTEPGSGCDSASESLDLLSLGTDDSESSWSSEIESVIEERVWENEEVASENSVAAPSGCEAAYDSLYLWENS
ncbi:hypothetical protein DSL72_001458 [Monilinia vaccinii-corymbosi]|uniref:Uncharacterized protein n=1 Tax=Monilinia vaccinii-corymbosi TaxID=61207 RepID=A0A8A3PA45_9HELO|nr:hypothetical protein DSL72_001458 [Monilinia vaccinii-corymbosi]